MTVRLLVPTSYITIACVSARRYFDLDAVRDLNLKGHSPWTSRAGQKEIDNPDRGTNSNGTGDNPAGIELYEANAELSRARVGMFLEVL